MAKTLWDWYLAKKAEIRDAHWGYLRSQYLAAEIDTNCNFLNRLGKKNGVESYSLFSGPFSRVEKYASEELYAWFEEHGRPTYEEFEKQYLSGEDTNA